jgi:hypothetical protein
MKKGRQEDGEKEKNNNEGCEKKRVKKNGHGEESRWMWSKKTTERLDLISKKYGHCSLSP